MTSKSPDLLFAVFRLEFRKTLFSRRNFWVYLLALAPFLLLAANSIYRPRERARLEAIAAANPQVTTAGLQALQPGVSRDDVVAQLGEPYAKRSERRRFGPNRVLERDNFWYTDGQTDVRLWFNNGRLARILRTEPETLDSDRLVFASIFQFYDLRLAVLLGCVGIFMNLIRGEMLDRSLHYYLLTPIPRGTLLAGKFAAGLAVSLAIFVASTMLQIAAMVWQYDGAQIAAYLQGTGGAEIASYLGVTVLACLGYGSLFLAAGLWFRNPLVPATAALLWESVNIFVPGILKRFSLIYYLQSLCPVPPPPDPNRPALLNALISSVPPSVPSLALGVILGLSVVALWIGVRLASRLEINYSVD